MPIKNVLLDSDRFLFFQWDKLMTFGQKQIKMNHQSKAEDLQS